MPLRSKDSTATKRAERGTNVLRGDWWNEKKDKIHEAVWPHFRAIQDEQAGRDWWNKVYYSMYLGHGASGIQGSQYASRDKSVGSLKVNYGRSMVDAANSKVTKNKVRVLYLTEGGEGGWDRRARAKRLTKAINGTFLSSGLYEENPDAQRDGGVFDLGAVYFYMGDDGKVCAERVPGSEIRVGGYEGRYGRPNAIHREKQVSRAELIEKYPEHEDAIRKSTISTKSRNKNSKWFGDMLDVVISHKLPVPGPKGKNKIEGVFCVTLPNVTLECSEYSHPHFPYLWHRWVLNPFGFYAQSICGMLYGLQKAANTVVDDIQEHVELSTGFLAIESGSVVGKQMFSNMIYRTVTFSGRMPQHVTPPSFQVEKLRWLQWIDDRSYEEIGMSHMFSTGQKDPGVTAAVAMREMNDTNSERFARALQRYEDTHPRAAVIIEGLYEDYAKKHGSLTVNAYGQKSFDRIDWKKARMDREERFVRAVATSFLPSTPGAKLQTISEMMEKQLIGREEALAFLDYPDIEALNNRVNAPYLNIERAMSIMLDPDDHRPVMPTPQMNLGLAMRRAAEASQEAELEGAPPEILKLLSDFMVNVERLQNPPLPPAPEPPPGPPALPPGPEMPPGPPGAPPPGPPPGVPPGPGPGGPPIG